MTLHLADRAEFTSAGGSQSGAVPSGAANRPPLIDGGAVVGAVRAARKVRASGD